MINALVFSRRMRDAGMDEKQAEELANAIDEWVASNAATKGDIEQLRTAVRGDIEATRADLKIAVEQLKTHTWQTCLTVCGAVGVIQIGVIYALIERLIAR